MSTALPTVQVSAHLIEKFYRMEIQARRYFSCSSITSFLDATVDVKGLAYETIVSSTLKQEAGQFFTPRNIVKCMVDIIDPKENQRVLDPTCGFKSICSQMFDVYGYLKCFF